MLSVSLPVLVGTLQYSPAEPALLAHLLYLEMMPLTLVLYQRCSYGCQLARQHRSYSRLSRILQPRCHHTSHLDEFLSESEGNLGPVPSKYNHLSCSGQNIHPHFPFPHFEQRFSFTGRDHMGFQATCVTSNMMASDQPPAPGLTATEEV